MGGQSSGDENECDHHRTDDRSDYKTQNEGELVLLLAEIFNELA